MARAMSMIVALMTATALGQANECFEPKDALSLLQTNLHVNMTKGGGESAADGTGSGLSKVSGGGGETGVRVTSDSQAAKARTIKLIVNSDVRYGIALESLFESMKKVSFDRWSDVVVMRGSAPKDSDPFIPDTSYGKLGVTYIDLKMMSFDLHGFSGLYHHRHDPCVKADAYLYMHDTVLVNSTFPEKFASMASTDKFEARHPPPPFSNICAFGSGVVDAYGTFFDIPKTKAAGLAVEFDAGDEPNNVVDFAQTRTVLENRVKIGFEVDVWHTGYDRTPFYYPSFGITKYIFWNRQGDLSGNVKSNWDLVVMSAQWTGSFNGFPLSPNRLR